MKWRIDTVEEGLTLTAGGMVSTYSGHRIVRGETGGLLMVSSIGFVTTIERIDRIVHALALFHDLLHSDLKSCPGQLDFSS